MSLGPQSHPPKPVQYPDSDGQPMADNTEQFAFIQLVQGNLDALLPDFVAGDHLWYPVQGQPEVRVAPDVYVALGRPKGHRGSYKQWEEAGVPPRVVFEWWSPGNTFADQVSKLRFYEQHGVEEFYTFTQSNRTLSAFHRGPSGLEPVSTEGGIESPLLGVRFTVEDDQFVAYDSEGKRFLSHIELSQAREAAEAKQAAAESELAALHAKLRAMGLDPSAL